ncbi:hypothetical protein CC85DRAFT_285595 [Cutaneotrichosporon oleaginosum]|uniref:t-SNARE coiled-coil homology domain-containing protein n=1 Tax=Cutaneotrichosporon oleaginosum TaxID=879819 RepID=A0A0J0XMI1_9TREE|nr:uncharacterized protein CC85DRAFT_285595 [Cutaneotrichosporon oleaginosum]KLT42360.1 hypothetical protein CC85DRAFT_285595 [Cutaneotrichosporon oleaginosum]
MPSTTDQTLEQQNEEELSSLHNKIKNLRSVTIDILDDSGRQNNQLDQTVSLFCGQSGMVMRGGYTLVCGVLLALLALGVAAPPPRSPFSCTPLRPFCCTPSHWFARRPHPSPPSLIPHCPPSQCASADPRTTHSPSLPTRSSPLRGTTAAA